MNQLNSRYFYFHSNKGFNIFIVKEIIFKNKDNFRKQKCIEHPSKLIQIMQQKLIIHHM